MSEAEVKTVSLELAARMEISYEKAEALVRKAIKEGWKSL